MMKKKNTHKNRIKLLAIYKKYVINVAITSKLAVGLQFLKMCVRIVGRRIKNGEEITGRKW